MSERSKEMDRERDLPEMGAALDDGDIKHMLGQAEVDKAVLRKFVKSLREKVSILQKENAILREALGEKGIKQNEKTV